MLANRRNRYTALALLGLVALAWILPPPASADGRRMEEIAMGWVEAHNSGEVERMRAYREAYRENTGPGWEAQFEELVERLGRLDVSDVLIDGDGELTLGVDSAAGPLRLLFTFSADDPERVARIRIDSGGRRPNPLPALDLTAGDWPARVERLAAYLTELATDDHFAGVVLIADGDELRFQGAYGLASREFAVPNTLDTRFDIGSITKDFTRVAVAQLLAAGKLGIDDTIGEHLPDYPNPAARGKVTVRHLFEHRSGIGDYFTPEWSATPMGALRDHDDYIAIWGPKELEFEPGTRQSYSNFGFTVLGAIIEAVSGETYFDYVAKHVFAPAGMTASGFFETDAVVPDVAVGYTWMVRGGERGDALRKNIYLEPAKGGPWGKTYSTAEDLWRFWTALSRHRLTPAAYTSWVLLDGPPPESPPLAGPADDADPILDVGLGGGGPGLSSAIEASEGRVFVVLSNLDPPAAMNLVRRLGEALERVP